MIKYRLIVIVFAILFVIAVFGTFFGKYVLKYCEENQPYWPEEEMEVMLKPTPTPSSQEGD